MQDREREPVREQEPVRKPGESVVGSLKPALLFTLAAVRDVDEASFLHGGTCRAIEGVLVHDDPDRRAIRTAKADLVVDEHALFARTFFQGGVLGRVETEIRESKPLEIVRRRTAQDAGERHVAFEDPSVEGRTVHARQIFLEGLAVPAFGGPERILLVRRNLPMWIEATSATPTRRIVIASIALWRASRTHRAASPSVAENASSRIVTRPSMSSTSPRRALPLLFRQAARRGTGVHVLSDFRELRDEPVPPLPDRDGAVEMLEAAEPDEEPRHAVHVGRVIPSLKKSGPGDREVGAGRSSASRAATIAEREPRAASGTPGSRPRRPSAM